MACCAYTNATNRRHPEVSICEWKCVDPVDKFHIRLVVDLVNCFQSRRHLRWDSDGDMDMAEGGANVNNQEQRDTGEKTNTAEWAAMDHYRDRTLAVQVALEDLTGETTRPV